MKKFNTKKLELLIVKFLNTNKNLLNNIDEIKIYRSKTYKNHLITKIIEKKNT